MLKKLVLSVVAVVTTLGVAAGGYAYWALRQIDEIPRFQATTSPSPDSVTEDLSTTSLLLFSVGSSGLSEEDGSRLGIGRGRAKMADGLTDSIMVVLTNPATRGISIVSIPRDTWVEEKGRRINAAFNAGGIDSLLDDVHALTGVRPQHQVSVNFAAFADVVDAVNGIDIKVENQVRDAKAKLLTTQPGCVHLSGADALAFARARHWSVSGDGLSWHADATSSDWGRVDRQQAIVRAMLARIAGPQLLTQIPALLGAAKSNLTFDSGLDHSRLLSLAAAWRSGTSAIVSSTYPGRGVTLDTGAQVIMPDIDQGRSLVASNAARIGYPVIVTTDSAETVSGESTSTTSVTAPSPIASPSAFTSPSPAASAAPTQVEGATVTSTTAPALLTPARARLSGSHVSSSPSLRVDLSDRVNTKPWRSDNGDGIGGTKYPPCSNGHAPRLEGERP